MRDHKRCCSESSGYIEKFYPQCQRRDDPLAGKRVGESLVKKETPPSGHEEKIMKMRVKETNGQEATTTT